MSILCLTHLPSNTREHACQQHLGRRRELKHKYKYVCSQSCPHIHLVMYIVETMLYVVICLLRGTDNCFILIVKVELGGNEQLAFPQIGCLFLPGNLGYFTVYLFASRLDPWIIRQ